MTTITEIIKEIEVNQSMNKSLFRKSTISNCRIENAISSNLIFNSNGTDAKDKEEVNLSGFEFVLFKNVVFENSKFQNFLFNQCQFINCNFENLEMTSCSFFNCIGISSFTDCSFTGLRFIDSRKDYRDSIKISNCHLYNSEFRSNTGGAGINLINSKCANTEFKVSISNSKDNNFQDVIISANVITASFYSNNNFENITFDHCHIKISEGDISIKELNDVVFNICEFHGYFTNIESISSLKLTDCKLRINNKDLIIKNSHFINCQIHNFNIQKANLSDFEDCDFAGIMKGYFEKISFHNCDLTNVKVNTELEYVSFRNSKLFTENFECIYHHVDFTDVNISTGNNIDNKLNYENRFNQLVKIRKKYFVKKAHAFPNIEISKGNLVYNKLNHETRFNRRGKEILYLTQVNIGLPQMGKITYCHNNKKIYSNFPVLLRDRTEIDPPYPGHNFEILQIDKYRYGIEVSKIKTLIDELYSEQLVINDKIYKKYFDPPDEIFDDKFFFSNQELKIYYKKILNAIDYLLDS